MSKRVGIASVATIAFLVFGSLVVPSEATGTSVRPQGLTAQGILRWDLEQLLRRTFGNHKPFVEGRADFDCAGTCSPLAKFSPFDYEFAKSSNAGPFRLGTVTEGKLLYGNYAVPLLIDGRAILCDSRASSSRVLVELANSSGYTLECVKPLRLPPP